MLKLPPHFLFRARQLATFRLGSPDPGIPQARPDLDFMLAPENRSQLEENLIARYGLSRAEAEQRLQQLHDCKSEVASPESQSRLAQLAAALPNLCHPEVRQLKEARVLQEAEPWSPLSDSVDFKAKSFQDLNRIHLGARWNNTVSTNTDRSYFLLNDFAKLEQALVRYAVQELTMKHQFRLVSVPDLLHPDILTACGMQVAGPITQVYRLNSDLHGPVVLSGTAEMALAGLFLNKKVPLTSPHQVKKFVAVSRCYRAESSRIRREGSIYRVHHFTKVEMFALTTCEGQVSDHVHREFLQIQKQLFDGLDLKFRVLDIPPSDLGDSAYRKFDVEVFYPSLQRDSPDGHSDSFYGEISSASNCTDYQSRRLNIQSDDGQFVHTVNGTACAIPRVIMALCEQHQLSNSSIRVPERLQPYMIVNEREDKDYIRSLPKKARFHTFFMRNRKKLATFE